MEAALSNNNINAGGSFIERGEQAINVRAVGLVQSTDDIARHRVEDAERDSGARARYRRGPAGTQDPAGPAGQGGPSGPRQGGGRSGCGLRHRAAAQGRRWGQRADGAAREGRFPQQSFPAAGSEDRSAPGSQRPGASDHAHGAAQPDRGNHSGLGDSLYLPRQHTRRTDRHAHDSVLAAVRVALPGFAAHSGQPAFAGRAGFRNDRGGRDRHGGEHRAPAVASRRQSGRDGRAEDQAGRARGAAAGILLDHDYHHRLRADLHAAARGRPPVPANGVDGGLRAVGGAVVLDVSRPGAGQHRVSQGHEGMAQSADVVPHAGLRQGAGRGDPVSLGHGSASRADAGRCDSAGSNHRVGVSAAPGRRRDLGARNAGDEHGSDRGHARS